MPHKDPDGIRDRLLTGLDNLVVAAPDPTGELSRAWTFQVRPGGWGHLIHRPLRVRDTQGNLRAGPLGAQSGIDYTRLYDSNGDDVLRIPDDQDNFFVYHFSVAVQNDRVRVYPRVPPTATHGAFRYLSANEPDPTAPDGPGYVLGRNMDFDNPPRELEQIAVQKGDESNIQFGFFNESPEEPVSVRLNVLGRAYMLQPITDEDLKRAIVAGDIPRTMVKLGTITESFEPGVPDEWDDAGIEVREPLIRGRGHRGDDS